jgi:hypothetical protein
MSTTVSPQLLHGVVHHAALNGRTEEDWWGSALETALAAASAVRHIPAHRGQAAAAAERLMRWWRDGQPRRVSADVAAVALTARAANDLIRRDDRLTRDAVQRVADLAERAVEIVPDLHIALCAWALDPLVIDRTAAPWPQLSARAARGTAYGLDETLRAYTAALAAERFDAAALTEALLRTSPTVAPTNPDASTALWLLTAVTERAAQSLDADEPGLRALIDRRGQLVDRLAMEVDETRSFFNANLDGLAASDEDDLAPAVRLSPMDTLLLDLSLASPEPGEPYLTSGEARALFGRREQLARRDERRWIGRAALLVTGIGLACGSALCFGLLLAGIAAVTAVWFSLAVAAAPVVAAAALWRRAGETTLAMPLAIAAATFTVFGCVIGVNDALSSPFLPDAAGVVTGALGTALVALIVAIVFRSFEDNPSARNG